MNYTVVAIWRDNMQRCAWHVENAASTNAAEEDAQKQAFESLGGEQNNPLLIAGVFEGILCAVDTCDVSDAFPHELVSEGDAYASPKKTCSCCK